MITCQHEQEVLPLGNNFYSLSSFPRNLLDKDTFSKSDPCEYVVESLCLNVCLCPYAGPAPIVFFFLLSILPCDLGNLCFSQSAMAVLELKPSHWFPIWNLPAFSLIVSPLFSLYAPHFLFLSQYFISSRLYLILFHSMRALYARCWNQTVERGEWKWLTSN